MTLTEKTAYIKGLVEGLELNADEKEVKVINAIIGLLDDMAHDGFRLRGKHERYGQPAG